MCDTAVVVEPGRVLFAKNSDRDPNEAQVLDWQAAAHHEAGDQLRCTWISIPQAPRTHAVVLSRPFWMWGAEMGANEHGLVIGNEAVFTRHAVPRTGLTGMDLLRLGLERAATAEEAVRTITRLIEDHGQGGGCGHEHRSFRYHSSFLLADPTQAYVLETAGPEWAVERVERGARTISNGLSIEPFATEHSDRVRTRIAQARDRRACTTRRAQRAESLADMIALLRDHGPGRNAPAYAWHNGAMGAPCVHAGGKLAASQTTSSWVAELRPDGCRHLATGTAAPCTSLFKPVAVDHPLDLGPAPTDRADPGSLWWRHEALHRRVLREPERLLPLFVKERDTLEERWLSEPPDPAEAFAEGDRQLGVWRARISAGPSPDRRPGLVRRYWAERNRRAGLEFDG